MAGYDNTDFYITIPSTTSLKYYQNTADNFRIQLPYMIDLHGSWTVGLSQISYKHSWYTITEPSNKIIITTKNEIYNCIIPPGYYIKNQELISVINNCIKEQVVINDNYELQFTILDYNGKCKINND